MAWTILFLVVLVSTGRFLDFIIGARGEKILRDHLIDFYVSVQTESWLTLSQSICARMAEFIDFLFTRRWTSYFFRTAIASISMSLTILVSVFSVAYGSLAEAFRFMFLTQFFKVLCLVILFNWLVDLVSWKLARYLFGVAGKSNSIQMLMLMFASLVSTYIGVCFAIRLTTSTTLVSLLDGTVLNKNLFEFWLDLVAITDIWLHPWNANMSIGETNFSIFAISVVFPSLMFAVVVLGGILLSVSKRFALKPLTYFLERVDEYKKGLFTLLSSFFAAIIAILAAVQKVL